MSVMATIRDRIYSDFLMPSRLGDYRHLLETALAAGYRILSIERYWRLVTDGALDPAGRHLVLRHDIDTDPQTAALMWQIERDLHVEGSYFFRLGTLDRGLMQRIADAGSRVSYHYEELATVAKRRRPADATAAGLLIPEAQELFERNIERLRSMTGLPMDVVASHGDFVNRKLGIKNTAILVDRGFRARMGIVLETYDQDFLDTVSSYHRDMPYPHFWMEGDPLVAIGRGAPIIYMLVHPKPWRVHRTANARDDATRLLEGLAYRLPARSDRRPA
jgi:hypothetical protein